MVVYQLDTHKQKRWISTLIFHHIEKQTHKEHRPKLLEENMRENLGLGEDFSDTK